MKKILILFSIIIIMLSACGSDGDKIKVGFIGPLTGDAAIIGEENLKGIQIAIEELAEQGTQIELIVKDDQMTVKDTLTQYRQLVDIENVNYVLTVTYSGYLSLAPHAEGDEIILIDSLDGSEEFSNLGENAFSMGIYDESIAYAIADYLNDQEVEEVGMILNIDDAFMALTESAFNERFSRSYKKEIYSFDTSDFRTVLSKFSEQDIILVLGWEETGRIVKQAKELGIEAQFIGIDTFASQDFRDNSGNNYEGLIFTFWQNSENNAHYDNMITSYQNKFGKQPDNVLFVGAGRDSMSVLGNALKQCGDEVNCVKQKIKETKDFQGATGKITIDDDHVTRSIKETMHMYKDDEIVAI